MAILPDITRSSQHRRDLRNLYLYGFAWLRRSSRHDDEITARDLVLALHHLRDRSGGIDDSRTCRVGHERRQWLERALAVGLLCKRKHVGLLWLQAGDGGLQDLDQA